MPERCVSLRLEISTEKIVGVDDGNTKTHLTEAVRQAALNGQPIFAWLPCCWKYFRVILLVVLSILPIVVYHDDVYGLLRRTWYAPLMGIVACAVPSCGAPVAGGIFFLPVLQLNGIDAHSAVAFSAATQMVGVGIFAPMNWLATDYTLFSGHVMLLAAVPSLAGLMTSLLLVPLESTTVVLLIFSAFCLFLAGFVFRSLLKAKPAAGQQESLSRPEQNLTTCATKKAPYFGSIDLPLLLSQQKDKTFKGLILLALLLGCFIGGLLTGYIGIGLEKVLFLMLTWHAQDERSMRQACVTSITMVGFLSAPAFVLHALCAPDGAEPNLVCAPKTGINSSGHVDGAVPYDIWLMVLPGILLGSMVGSVDMKSNPMCRMLRSAVIMSNRVADLLRPSDFMSKRMSSPFG